MNICRYMKNAGRIEAWTAIHGPMPEGYRLRWTCAVQYCGKVEHMELVESLTYGRNSWKEIGQKLAALPLDGYFDVPEIANDEASRNNMMCGLRNRRECALIQFSIRSLTKSSGGVRVIRVGGYCGQGTLVSPTESLAKHPLLISTSAIRPWQRPTPVWMGQFFNPTHPTEYTKPLSCKVAGCVFPVLHGAGDYCYQHNHWFDYPISMTDTAIDHSSIARSYMPLHWQNMLPLSAEFPRSMDSLERSLAFELTNTGMKRPRDERHKNAGGEGSAIIKEPVRKMTAAEMIDQALSALPRLKTDGGVTVQFANKRIGPKKSLKSVGGYSNSPVRFKMRRGGGSHSGSKTTRGKAKAAARQGKGSRHTTKEKRWTRETIEALERQADLILGERPLDIELNFIPEADRETDDLYEYEEPERYSAVEQLFDKKNEFEELFGA